MKTVGTARSPRPGRWSFYRINHRKSDLIISTHFLICSRKVADDSHYEESWVVSGFWSLNFARLEDNDIDIKH